MSYIPVGCHAPQLHLAVLKLLDKFSCVTGLENDRSPGLVVSKHLCVNRTTACSLTIGKHNAGGDHICTHTAVWYCVVVHVKGSSCVLNNVVVK